MESNVSDQPYNDIETKCGAMNRARNAYYYHCCQDVAVTSSKRQQDDDDDSAISSLSLPDLAIGIEGGLEIHDTNRDENTSTDTGTAIMSANYQQQNMNHNDDMRIKTISPNTTDTTKIQPSKQLYCMAWVAIYGRRTTKTNAIFATMMTDKDAPVTSNNVDEEKDKNDHLWTTNPPIVTTDTKEIYGFSKTAMFLLPPSLCTLILDQGMELGHADDVLFRRTNSKQASGTVGLLTNSIIDRATYYEHAILLAMIPWMHPNLFPNGHMF